MRPLLTMTLSDLRQRLRDKSVLIFALLVPLALMSVFNLVFGGMDEQDLGPVTVATATPDDDPVAGSVRQTLDGLDISGMEVTVDPHPPDEVRPAVEAGDAGVGLVIPEGFSEAVRSGEDVEVRAIEGDGSGLESRIVLSVVDGMLDQFAAGSVTARAGLDAGLPPTELGALAEAAATGGPDHHLVRGETSDEQLGSAATIVAGQAGLFLLFTVSFGVIGLVTEREQGTLARLRSMPMAPSLIVVAKALVSFLLGLASTSVLLTAGSLLFGVDFGSLPAVGLLVLGAVTATTSLMLVIARLARTTEQAGVASSIVAVVLGMAGGAFFPVGGTGALGQLLDLNPVAAFVRGLGITAGGGGVTDLGAPLAVMLGFTAVMVAVSRLVPDTGAAA